VTLGWDMLRFLNIRNWPKRAASAALLMLAAVLSGCAGGSPLGLSPSQEAQIGADQHPKILASYGGSVEDQKLAGYVATIAGRLKLNTETPNMPLRVTVLDSPIVNAFALPGGYIYATRGLMALANSEAELAGVLAHEIGHVTARHTAKRVESANVTGILSQVAGILLGSPQVASLAGQAGQLYLLNFSRSQEYEADSLGVRYLANTGYDPFAQADFLASMGAKSDLSARMSGGSRPPEFLSSHPSTPKRVEEAIREAEQSGVRINRAPRKRDVYLNAINGMIYGDGPKQGYVRGQTFSHPQLRFTFRVPNGYKLQNSPSAVAARGPNNITIQFVGDKASTNPQNYLSGQFSKRLGIQFGNVQATSVGGFRAARGSARARTNSGTVDVSAVAIAFSQNDYYTFFSVSPTNVTSQATTALNSTVNSFGRLSAAQARALKPLRIRVVQVRSGDTVASLARRMKVDQLKEAQFRVLNGLGPNAGVRAGQRVKLVRE